MKPSVSVCRTSSLSVSLKCRTYWQNARAIAPIDQDVMVDGDVVKVHIQQ